MKSATAALAASLVVGLVSSLSALASDPASQDVAAPTKPGQTVVVEWTGTALPGASGAGTTGSAADDSTAQPCAPVGPDDGHTINLSGVPAGQTVTADFHVEWEKGQPDPSGSFTDPDMVLTVYKDTTDLQGYSDGGSPEENVGLTSATDGAYNAIVCPFLSSKPTPYRAKLTLTAVEPNACLSNKGQVVTNATSTGGASGALAEAAGLRSFDQFELDTRGVAKAVPTDLHGRYQAPIYDRALGVPTFLWARTDAPVAAVGALNARDLLVERARAHLQDEAKELHLTRAVIDSAKVSDAQFNGDGPAVVRFQQQVDGVDVFHRSLNVLLNREFRPVAVSGYFAPEHVLSGARALDSAHAVVQAWAALGGELDASALTATGVRGGWDTFDRPAVTGTHFFERGPRAKAIWYPRAAGLEPAWLVEIFASAKYNGQLMAYALVVSASDGALLHRENLKADAAFTYRVFADPSNPLHQPYDGPLGNGYAPFPGSSQKDHPKRIKGGSQLVTLDNAGIRTGDSWLAEDATETVSNHVDACLDTYDQGVNTPAGGLAVPPPVNSCVHQPADVEPRGQATGPQTFDYPITADDDPASDDAKGAAVVNLFYMNNWLHDWWYNHGFDEVSGNAQTSNFGRGGEEGDPVLAQGQDGSGRDNANMATPSDGSSPVMQQYLFDGPLLGEVRETAPLQGQPLTWTIIHDTGQTDYNFDGALALANDGVGLSPNDGCGPAVPYPDAVTEQGLPLPLGPVAPPDQNLRGKIALVDRGNCNTTYKIQFAIASGAIGLIVVNNVDGDPPNNIGNLDIPLAPVEPTHYAYAQMPTVIIRKDDGDALKAQLAAGEVTMHMDRTASIDVDGTLDNQVIAHEYFHYVHHRLTASSNHQSQAMSEGWGDIDAFMLTVRGDDRGAPGNAGLGGAYGLAAYVTNNFFAGIRRAPYSTSFDYNGYTLRHIADGEPEPNGGAGATNSEVHSAGEIWANEMFECYVGIQNNPHHGFDDARSAMQDYIIGGFKMTPADATYTEARDAVLSVVLASDFGDYSRCSHGFAKRGNGLNAAAPARSSSDLTGVVEDFGEFVCAGKQGTEEKLPEGHGLLVGALNPALLLPLFGLALLRRRARRRAA